MTKLTDAQLRHIAKVASRSSTRAEARAILGLSESTLRTHLADAETKGFFKRTTKTYDKVDIAKRDIEKDLKKQLTQLQRDAIGWDSIREGVLKLVTPPPRPVLIPPKNTLIRHEGRTVIIHLSDLHCGERVSLDALGGLNRYNIDIFRQRMSRLAHKAVSLMTEHWKGKPPEKIVVIFGGDLISGEIHEELAKTNDALASPAVLIAVETLAGVVEKLAAVAPVDVYSLAGNHGRLTRKPESKGFVSNSLDTLIGQVVEMTLKGDKRIRFFYPESGDALINVYGLIFCVNHGDRNGSKGGQGFLGALATIIRGMHKVHAYYASQKIRVDFVMQGHLHTTGYFPSLGMSNGSGIGPSEYGRDLKARPEEAKQNMIVVHATHGVIDFKELKIGDPSEGSIYRSSI